MNYLDNIKIKKTFLYNQNLYNKLNNKKKRKIIKFIVISILIIFMSVLTIIKIASADGAIEIPGIIAFLLILLPAVFFFILFYNLLMLGTCISDKDIFSDRVYAITTDDKFILFRFARNFTYYRRINGGIIESLLRYLIFRKNVNDENDKFVEKVNNDNIDINELIECSEVINVYDIKDNKENVEITCDYVDLVYKKVLKKQNLTIYKFFENWEEINKFLKLKIKENKKQITYESGKYQGFITFVLAVCLNKRNNIISYAFPFIGIMYGILSNSDKMANSYMYFLLAITYFIILVHSEKKALGYTNDSNEQSIIKNKLKKDRIFMGIYFFFLIIFILLYHKNLYNIFGLGLLIFFFVFIIIKKINKW